MTPLTLFLFGSCLVASGCGSAPARRMATVNGEPVTATAFDHFLELKLGDFAHEPLDDSVRSQLFDDFVAREVTVQAARKRGLRITPDVAHVAASEDEPIKAEIADDLLVEKYYREVVLRDVCVTPEEVAAYYETHRASFDHSKGYYVREIRVERMDEAERLRGEIALGKLDFAAAARASSSSASRGALVYYQPGQLPPALDRAVAGLAEGQVSPVIRTGYGYHLLKLENRSAPLPLGRVRDVIADELRARKNERLVEADSERLLAEARVALDRGQIGFRYEGRFGEKK